VSLGVRGEKRLNTTVLGDKHFNCKIPNWSVFLPIYSALLVYFRIWRSKLPVKQTASIKVLGLFESENYWREIMREESTAETYLRSCLARWRKTSRLGISRALEYQSESVYAIRCSKLQYRIKCNPILYVEIGVQSTSSKRELAILYKNMQLNMSPIGLLHLPFFIFSENLFTKWNSNSNFPLTTQVFRVAFRTVYTIS